MRTRAGPGRRVKQGPCATAHHRPRAVYARALLTWATFSVTATSSSGVLPVRRPYHYRTHAHTQIHVVIQPMAMARTVCTLCGQTQETRRRAPAKMGLSMRRQPRSMQATIYIIGKDTPLSPRSGLAEQTPTGFLASAVSMIRVTRIAQPPAKCRVGETQSSRLGAWADQLYGLPLIGRLPGF